MPTLDSKQLKDLVEHQIATETNAARRQALRRQHWTLVTGNEQREWGNERSHYVANLPAGWTVPAAAPRISSCGCGGSTKAPAKPAKPLPFQPAGDTSEAEEAALVAGDFAAMEKQRHSAQKTPQQSRRERVAEAKIALLEAAVREAAAKAGRAEQQYVAPSTPDYSVNGQKSGIVYRGVFRPFRR